MDRLRRPESTSRPIRLAARLREEPEVAVEHLFRDAHVLIRLEPHLSATSDGRITFLEIANQILRFCPNVSIAPGLRDAELIGAFEQLVEKIIGPDVTISVVDLDERIGADAIVNVGTAIGPDESWTTVNSSGYVGRMAPGGGPEHILPWSPYHSNPLGALAAACLGSGGAFLRLARMPPPPAHELSLLTGKTSDPGTLGLGLPLPEAALLLNGLLVGSGGTGNGWTRAMASLPVTGRLAAVDRQSLRHENIGPYVLAGHQDVGRAKTELIRDAVAARLVVDAYNEDLELFKVRLGFGQELPPIVVAGLDRVQPRHSLQRLWPNTLIDMGAGGTTAQVIVHRRGDGTQCLLGALTVPPHEQNFADESAVLTGLRPDRIRDDPTGPITEADVEAAPRNLRAELDRARRRGERLCGRLTERSLHGETAREDFAPAAPFVSALSGTKAAVETVMVLLAMPSREGRHWQYDFRSGRARALAMKCVPGCECLTAASRSA